MAIAYNTSIVRNGLVLYLDAANVKSYPGSGTTWNDLSGNGRNMSLINGPTFANGVFSFDGVEEYATINDSNLYVDGNTNNATYNLWFNLKSGGAQGENRGLIGGLRNNTGVLMSYNDGGTMKFRWFWDDGFLTSTSAFNLNTWNNVVVVLEPSYFVTIYLNGSIALTKTQSPDTVVIGPIQQLSIARQNRDIGTPPYEYAQVDISAFSQYNRALTAGEVQQNFEALRGRYGV